MNLSDLKAMGDMAIEYFKDKQSKGYSQAEVINEIFSNTEGKTHDSVKNWVQREQKKYKIKFANGNEKRKKKSTTKTIEQNKAITDIEETVPQNVPQEIPVVATIKVVPQEVPQQEHKLYLELLERVEKIEQQLSNKPIEPQEPLFDGMYINSGIRVHKDTWKDFNEFCSTSKESKQLLVTKALYEYLQNHK